MSGSDATGAASTTTTTEADDPAPRDATPSDRFMALLDAALTEVDDQVLVTQGRCVDHLLDLFNATENVVLRHMIVRALDSVRSRHAVNGVDIHITLSVVAAAANVEFAFTFADADAYATE